MKRKRNFGHMRQHNHSLHSSHFQRCPKFEKLHDDISSNNHRRRKKNVTPPESTLNICAGEIARPEKISKVCRGARIEWGLFLQKG